MSFLCWLTARVFPRRKIFPRTFGHSLGAMLSKCRKRDGSMISRVCWKLLLIPFGVHLRERRRAGRLGNRFLIADWLDARNLI